MLGDLTHWLSSLSTEELVAVFLPLFLVDSPRYAVTRVAMCFFDLARDGWRVLRGRGRPGFDHCPTVCVIMTGHNEEDTVYFGLNSVYGTYPRLEVIFIDDGSTDATFEHAKRFAREHPNVRLLRKPRRGGKTSSFNFALQYTRAEVVITMDTDSQLAPNAVWELVQPFRDPRVGVVSGSILVRNPFENVLTRLQAFEYLQGIFVGRLLTARMGILSLASGAFGAYRREPLERLGGWDIGPGEDSDAAMRLRKIGYTVAHRPYAQCYTNVPTKWARLYRQRLRWNRGAIRSKCRKHIDMAMPWRRNFRITNLLLLMDSWFFHTLVTFSFWSYFVWLLFHFEADTWKVMTANFMAYMGFHVLQVVTILYYSTNKPRDALVCAIVPLVTFYNLFRRFARLVAVTGEIFLRRSYKDSFYPRHVQAATWHW